jgi:dephospho-CoA kinase
MKVIGITGGIGSGKSTVCRVFHSLGIPVFNADDEAKDLYNDMEVKKNVMALLGKEAYVNDLLDRAFVASKVFSTDMLLKGLNAIIHPAVQQRFEKWCSIQRSVYVLKEAAILFEAGSDKGTDAVIMVSAPRTLRIKRVMQRDGVTEEQVERRMKNQWSDEEKIKRSAYIIYNDEEQLVLPQVLKLHEELGG